MTERTRRRVRAGLVYLAASFVVVGLWATLAPSSFYDGFPGGGRHWVAGEGPYNARLVGDDSVGFLAVGLVLLLAAVWTDIRLIQAASVAVMVHDAPPPAVPPPPPERITGVAGHLAEQRRAGLQDAHRAADPRRRQPGRTHRDLLAAAGPGDSAPRRSPEKARAQLSGAIPTNKEEL